MLKIVYFIIIKILKNTTKLNKFFKKLELLNKKFLVKKKKYFN